LQGRYSSLVELYEKQRSYGQKVSELLSALQQEVDAIIQIPARVVGEPYTAAYLASDAVIVMFDVTRDMTSKPLRSFPAPKIVAIVQACTPELKRLISEKEKSENVNLRSLERVARELEEAQAMFTQIKMGEPPTEPERVPEPRETVTPEVVKPAPAVEATSEEESPDSSDVDEVILAAVGEGLKILGQDASRGVTSLLEKRYGFSMKDIPYHPRGFMEILDELVGSSARLIEKKIITEIKKTYPVEGETFYEVVKALRGRASGGSAATKKPPTDGPSSSQSADAPSEQPDDGKGGEGGTKPIAAEYSWGTSGDAFGGPYDVDDAVSKAVDKGLDVLGNDGKQVILKLLEDRYGLRKEDIPRHPRGFVELLEGMVGSGGRVIEKEIISEISKTSAVQGDALYEVVSSMRGEALSHKSGARNAGGVSLEQISSEESTSKAGEDGTRPQSSDQAASQADQNGGMEEASPAVSTEEPSPAAVELPAYNYSFKVESKPVPISEFLIA
jgi:hypothetical protein